MSVRFWPLMSALAILSGVALADPVPERYDTQPRPRSGTRGLTELRDPSLAATDLAQLLRSCARCHSERGPNTRLFERGRLASVPLAKLRWSVGVVLTSAEDAAWYPTDAERRDLERAQTILGK